MERERRERRERKEKNQTEEEVASLPVKGKGGSWIFFRGGSLTWPHHQFTEYFTANYFHPSW